MLSFSHSSFMSFAVTTQFSKEKDSLTAAEGLHWKHSKNLSLIWF